MDIFEHPLCNLLLKAPPDRPEVVDLPAWRGMVEVVDPSIPNVSNGGSGYENC